MGPHPLFSQGSDLKEIGTTMRATARIQSNKALRQTLASKLDQAATSFDGGTGFSACPEPKAKARVKKEKVLKATHSLLTRDIVLKAASIQIRLGNQTPV